AVRDDELARALLDAREQAAEHHRVATCRDGLGDVTRVLDATVRDDRDPARGSRPGRVKYRRNLWHAYPGYHACCADRVMRDCVVGDEAVRWAINLEIIHGHGDARALLAESPHHQIVAQPSRLACETESRAEAESAPPGCTPRGAIRAVCGWLG